MTHTVRLPDHWATATLGGLAESEKRIAYGVLKPGPYTDGGVPMLRVKDIAGNAVDVSDVYRISEELHAEFSRTHLIGGEILVSIQGTVGRVAIVPDHLVGGNVSRTLGIVPLAEPSLGKWVWCALQSPQVQTEMRGYVGGTTRDSLNLRDLRILRIPVAPKGECDAIVEAIESYLTRLDDAIASLERVQRNLERYRASVLKAAVEGRLVPTEAQLAHQEGRDYEPASVLLERILAERKTRWIEDAAEKARSKAEAKALKAGKPWTPEDNAKTLEKARKTAEAKYKEPAPPDTTDLPDLPEGWCWTTFGAVAKVRGGFAFKSADYTSDPTAVPLIRQSELRSALIDTADAKRLPSSYLETYGHDYGVRKGDILVGLSGSLSSISRYIDDTPSLQNQRTGLLEISSLMNKDYILSAYLTLVPVIEQAGKGVGVQNVSPKQIEAMAIPIPPFAEQARIAEEIDRTQSVARSVGDSLDTQAQRASRLRQSILKWAFEGKLVEQDPEDEPAAALLERIRSETASAKR